MKIFYNTVKVLAVLLVCFSSATQSKAQCTSFDVAITQDDLCNSNGIIDVTYFHPYSIVIQYPNNTTDTVASESDVINLNGLYGGSYTISLVDPLACSETILLPSIDVATSVFSPSFTTNGYNVACHGDCTGSIFLNQINPQGTYTIEWYKDSIFGTPFFTTTSSGSSQNNLCAGDYYFLFISATGCETPRNFTLREPDTLNVEGVVTEVFCSNESTGLIDIEVTGGVGDVINSNNGNVVSTEDYSFSWSSSTGFTSTDEDVSGLAEGLYSVIVTDDNNCTFNRDFTVVDTISPLQLSFVSQDSVLCFGDATGGLQVLASGARGPYEYRVDGQTWQNSGSFLNLTAGFHNFEARDTNGCIVSESFEVLTYPQIFFDVVSLDFILCKDSLGSFEIQGVGGNPSYTYVGISPQSSGLFENLTEGDYTVFIEDKNTCVTDTIIKIESIPFLSHDIIAEDLNCFESSDGFISVSASLGTAPYVITVDTLTSNSSNFDVLNLSVGNYSINITDNSGCPFDTTIQLNQPADFILSFDNFVEPSCFGLEDGSIAVNQVGAQGDLTYQWFKDSFPMFVDTSVAVNLGLGFYEVFAVDDSSCTSDTISFDLGEPSQLSMSLDSLQDPLCNGGADGYIHVDATGGSTPYSFSWIGTFDFGKQYNGLTSGSYQVVVSDLFDCRDTLDFNLSEPQPIAFNPTITDVNCFGQSTGEIVVDVSGGVGPYVLTTSSSVGTVTSSSPQNITLQNVPFGQYTFTALDSNLCTKSENFDVSENTEIQASFSNIISETCDDDNAEVTVIASAGTPPYTYDWVLSGQTTTTAVDISGGENKFVNIKDSLNCSKEFIVFVPKILAVSIDSINVTNNFCAGDSDGQIEVNSSGTSYPLTYTLSGIGDFETSDASYTITNLLSNTYTLSVADSNGCTDTQTSIAITENDSITFQVDSTLSTSMLTCNGDVNGEIFLNISGGLPFPGDYYWLFVNDPDFSQQITTDSISGLSAGIQNLFIQDANGCTNTLTYEIKEPEALSVVNILTNVSCNGYSDGEALIIVSGGTPNFTLTSNSSSLTIVPLSTDTFKISGLSEGVYFYDIVDANGCKKLNNSFYISEPSSLEVTGVSSTLESCLGWDATATVMAAGGTTPYSYVWSYDEDSYLTVKLENNTVNPTVNNSVIENLTSGWYYVRIIDYKYCDVIDSIYITQTNSPSLSLLGTVNNLCHDGQEGQISLSAVDGNPFYEYSINSGDWQFLPTFGDLPEGFYNATVRDSLGCTDELEDIQITSPSPINVEVNTVDAGCVGSSDGSATAVSVSGGTPSASGEYSYSWKNENGTNLWPANSSGINPTVNNLFPGTYQLEVNDVNGCSITYSPVIIAEPTDITLDLSVLSSYNGTDISCFGYSDGIILANANGGSPPYTFKWSTNQSLINTTTSSGFDTLFFVSQGNYSVEVSDSRGCQLTDDITINHPEKIEIDFEDVIHIRCEGNSDGQATATYSGGLGFGVYSVVWTDNQNNTISLSPEVSNLSAGTYFATYSDNNGCTEMDSITIDYSELFAITNTEDTTSVSCLGSIDGSFNFNISGGWLPYTYEWNDPLNQQSATAVGLAPNFWYTNVITDAQGCILIDSVFVSSPIDLVEISFFEVIDNACYGDTSGSISLDVVGGTPNYIYQWSGPGTNASTKDISDLLKGTYNVLITDGSGCEITASYEVEGPDNPLLINSVVTTDVSCNGFEDGTANIDNQVVGGTTPYINEDWGGENPSQLSAGSYTVVVTDDNGCEASVSYTIFEPDAYSVELDVINEYCEGQDGKVIVHASGGTAFTNGYYNYSIAPISGISPELTYQTSAQDDPNIVLDFPSDNDVSDTLFLLTIEDNEGCIYTEEFEIHPARIFDYNQSIDVCYGDSIVLDGNRFSEYDTYTWSIIPLQDIYQDESDLGFVVRNSSQVYITVTDYASTCSFTDELDIVVLKPVISTNEDFGIVRGESATLSIIDGQAPYAWSTSEMTSDIVVSPLITTHYVAYALDTLTGCIGNDTVRVFVGMNEGFSPNNDGYNDSWEISYLNQYESAKIEIFNRWGSSLWSSSYPNIENWDGKYNGSDLPVGTYYYIITFDNSLNKEPLTGPVTIVR